MSLIGSYLDNSSCFCLCPDSFRYGDIVQLQHVKSGAFVTVLESAAPVDPECRGVVLDKKGTCKQTKSSAHLHGGWSCHGLVVAEDSKLFLS